MNARHLFLPALVVTLAACERAPASAPKSAQPAAPQVLAQPVAASPGQLTRVEQRDQVCMVNDQFMGRPQIPVEVEGRTYFGCCAMCKGRLAQERATRVAIDPVSGQEVDKARAVIAQDSSGKVTYFENEANFAAYTGPSR